MIVNLEIILYVYKKTLISTTFNTSFDYKTTFLTYKQLQKIFCSRKIGCKLIHKIFTDKYKFYLDIWYGEFNQNKFKAKKCLI